MRPAMTTTTKKSAQQGTTTRLLLALGLAVCAAGFADSAWALSVSLTAPANNAVFAAPAASIALAATATPTNSSRPIAKVEFFRGTTLIGTDTTSPYSFTWTNVATGSYTLTAKATDKNAIATTSAPVTITVDTPPTVSITAPANNALFIAPASVTVSASASDTDGTVAKVDFFDGATLV